MTQRERGRLVALKKTAKQLITQKQAVTILSRPEYAGFGPTLAAEYLEQRHGIHLGRETPRGCMTAAGLWKGTYRGHGEQNMPGTW